MGKHSNVFRWLNADGMSEAKCDCGVDPRIPDGCPCHDPEVYARVWSLHRADTN